MKYLVLCHILVFLLCVSGLAAQTVLRDSTQVVQSTQASVQAERTALNTVHLELLGLGAIYSLSYEGHLSKNLAARFGAGFTPLGLYIPFTISGFIGDGKDRCEIGGGVIWQSGNNYRNAGFNAGLRLGYRYQPLGGGFNFAVTFTPIIFLVDYSRPNFQPYGGISLGWSF
jgi:hypothetical protein